ncbi:MAG: PRC-barrel domain-containing protein [Actinomycetota bacterium]|nr:PRC-barrel domain-containing protein [Actinomycetota bacterium]
MSNDDEIRGSGQSPDSSMSGSARFRIGTEVVARDAVCGELSRVIIDPVAKALTHLVVAPRHHGGLGQLVPIELVEATHDDQIRLNCDAAQFRALEDSQDVEVLPASSSAWGYGTGQAQMWPYYGLGMGAGGVGMGLGGGPQPVVIDRVPLGEVQVRRGDQVHATDGWIGSVQGLVIDPKDHHVTHVLLQEGHLWGRKQVAIPIRTTSRMQSGIRVELTKDQVHHLPPVDLSSSP